MVENSFMVIDRAGTVGTKAEPCLSTFVAGWVTSRVAHLAISVNVSDEDVVQRDNEVDYCEVFESHDVGVSGFVASIREICVGAEGIAVTFAVWDLEVDGCELGLPIEALRCVLFDPVLWDCRVKEK